MGMQVRTVPNCCTMDIVTGFKQSIHAGGNWDEGPEPSCVEVIENFLRKAVVECDRYGRGIVTATTNSDQTLAIKALNNLGFQSSTWVEKGNHADVKLRLWWIDAPNYVEGQRLLKAKE